jgi:hypothetical protein
MSLLFGPLGIVVSSTDLLLNAQKNGQPPGAVEYRGTDHQDGEPAVTPSGDNILSPAEALLVLAGEIAGIALILTAVSGTIDITGNISGIAKVISPANGEVVKTGIVPSITWQYGPASGSIIKGGNTPVLQKQLVPTEGALILGGEVPSFTSIFNASSASVIISGEVPSVTQGGGGTTIQLSPSVGAISLLGYAPSWTVGPGYVGRASWVVLNTKAAAETVSVEFDFTSLLSSGDSLVSASTLASTYSGIAADLTIGAVSTDGQRVAQLFADGTPGCVYLVSCTAEGTTGAAYTLSGYLAVTS